MSLLGMSEQSLFFQGMFAQFHGSIVVLAFPPRLSRIMSNCADQNSWRGPTKPDKTDLSEAESYNVGLLVLLFIVETLLM
jgi:hypothetical protein